MKGYGAWLCGRLTYLKERLSFYGTAISLTLLQRKELIGKVETKFSLLNALVVSDRTKTLFRQLKKYRNDNDRTYLK